MAWDSEGLMDFGTGAFQGGMAAGMASGGNPVAMGAGAVGMGVLSYFGGAPQRRLEKKVNTLQLKGMEQDLELGEFKIGEAQRARAMDMDAKKRQEAVGRLLAKYFARKQGVK